MSVGGNEDEAGVPYAGQTPDLFANPADTIWDAFHALNNGYEETVCDFHQHG